MQFRSQIKPAYTHFYFLISIGEKNYFAGLRAFFGRKKIARKPAITSKLTGLVKDVKNEIKVERVLLSL